MVELAEEHVESCLLKAGVLHLESFLYVWYGFGILALAKVDVGEDHGHEGLAACGEAVSLGSCHEVFGIVVPLEFGIAAGFEQSGSCHQIGFCLVEALYVGEGGGCLHVVAFAELCFAHEHPCPPQEGVVFFLTEPCFVFSCLRTCLLPFGALGDAVCLYGLLAFLHRCAEVGCAYL